MSRESNKVGTSDEFTHNLPRIIFTLGAISWWPIVALSCAAFAIYSVSNAYSTGSEGKSELLLGVKPRFPPLICRIAIGKNAALMLHEKVDSGSS